MGGFYSKFLKYSNLAITEETEPAFGNEKLVKIANAFYFSTNELELLHQIYRKVDKNGTGFITLDDLFYFITEELTSIVYPYLERFFLLIEKENAEKVTFIEWLPAASVFCLYTKEKIIRFVFDMLDSDHDNLISKSDLYDFLSLVKFGRKLYPYNYIRVVENLETSRGDQINFDQFKKMHTVSIPFVCFPAFRLQEQFREKIIGKKFWKETFTKIQRVEAEENRKKQINKLMEEVQRKKNLKVIKKLENMPSLNWDEFQEETYKKINTVVRSRNRRISDGMIPPKVYFLNFNREEKRSLSVTLGMTNFTIKNDSKLTVESI